LAEFKNPQQEPGMERRLLLVFVVTLLLVALAEPLLKKFLPQPPAQPAPASTQTQPQPPQNEAISTPSVPQPKGEKPQATLKQASTESPVVIENDLYRITFTNRGAQVKSWVMKKFDDDKGQPLELVNNPAAEKFGYPLSLWTYDETQRNKLNSVLYVSSSSGTLTAPTEVTFEYADQDLEVRKTFGFYDTYVVHVEIAVSSKGNQVTAFPMWPAGFGDETTLAAYAAGRVEYQYNGNIERTALKKVSSGNTLHGPFNWIAATDQYFAAVFIPDDPQDSAAVTLRYAIDIPKDPQKPNPADTIKAEVPGLAVGNLHRPTVEQIYVGPKELRTLETVPVPTIVDKDPDLRALINFGFFQVIARPLFAWLRWTYGAPYIGVHNWGWAIVIQTLIINLVLLPLRISSMKSALKMQKIQPQMNAIKEKYKKYALRDPRRQEMNTEIGEMMKREGVSPVGGCLPMVIQMPFLFAYYGMLGAALDLRHAHWLWIKDLSSADPYLILPILIIVTGLLTQRMTPQAGMDPSQQKMMNVMMPVMFGFISYRLAAGLCLYWCESSLVAIVQQLVMNRTSLGREMRELALKRARKKEKK
jgi:YidC/Oxa1 family membrane protein insertase